MINRLRVWHLCVDALRLCVRLCARVCACVRVCARVCACVRVSPRVCACERVCVCASALTRSHTYLREGLWRFWACFGGKNGLTWVGFEPLTCQMAAKGSNPYATGQLGVWLQGEPAHMLCAGGIPLSMSREAQLWASIAKKRCEMGRRRCFHRLLRQKLCIRVSSDQKSISRTLKGVFVPHQDSNPRPVGLKSVDLPSGPACRC